MEEKDNAYAENARAEDLAKANTGAEGADSSPKTASTATGKFKDVDALLKAYDCLQAEFTRRSQRLKKLEREAENFKAERESAVAAEKLRKNAERAKAEEDEFDSFVSDIERASVRAQTPEPQSEEKPAEVQPKECETPMAEIENAPIAAEETEGARAGEKAREDGESDKPFLDGKTVANSRMGLSSEELYTLASRNEGVRLKIIGEYLSSVGKSGAPLSKGGAGALSAPPVRAKTVREAGQMALRWFQREGAGNNG